MLSKESFYADYCDNQSLYERLRINLVEALRVFLQEAEIPFLDISSRIKNFDSAWEKTSRKCYLNPLDQIEDFCGIRVVCYYPSHVSEISKVLRSEFQVESEEDTACRLNTQEFGYRSTHFILKIKDSWLAAPQFRGLDSIKAEVQVRTILMHAWAEIEHKLAYKSVEQVPDEFRRKLYRLSAKFEEADEQFDDLRSSLESYREFVRSETKSGLELFCEKELNLDTFQVFLDMAYPDLEKSSDYTSSLLKEILDFPLSISDLVEAVLEQRKYIEKFIDILGGDVKWAQVGAMRSALDIYNDKYYEERAKVLGSVAAWRKEVKLGRELLAQEKLATKP